MRCSFVGGRHLCGGDFGCGGPQNFERRRAVDLVTGDAGRTGKLGNVAGDGGRVEQKTFPTVEMRDTERSARPIQVLAMVIPVTRNG